MKLITTLYEGFNMSWRIKVDPKGIRKPNGTYENDGPIISFWTPNGSDDKILIFNPKVALTTKLNTNKGPAGENLLIPINIIHTFANRLALVYQGLTKDGLKKRDGNHLYLDKNITLEVSKKISLYNKTCIITPTVLTDPWSDLELLGVQFSVDGKYCGSMTHDEVRELCEILSHTDIQVYILLLSSLEKLETMDNKLDTIIEQQQLILSALRENGMIKTTQFKNDLLMNQSAGLNWSEYKS